MCVYFCTQALDIQIMLSLLSPRFNDCYHAVDRELLTAAAPKHVDDLRNGTRVEWVFAVFVLVYHVIHVITGSSR